VLAALPLLASGVLSVGPEIPLGQPYIGPWLEGEEVAEIHDPPALATDGDRTLVAFFSQFDWTVGAVYVLLVDRDGHADGAPRLLTTVSNADAVALTAVWVNGTYVLFCSVGRTSNYSTEVLRLSAGGDLLGNAILPEGTYIENAAIRGDEILAIVSRGRWSNARDILRMSADLANVERIPLPTRSSHTNRAIAVTPYGTAIFTTDSDGADLRMLDGSRLSEPVNSGRLSKLWSGAGAAKLVWTGHEYVAAWTDCSSTSWDCSAAMARFDREGRYLDGRFLGIARGFPQPAISVERIDAETVFVAWSVERVSYGQRFRAGQPLDPKPVRVGNGDVGALSTVHGLTIVDATVRLARVVPSMAPLPEKLTAAPLFTGAADEVVVDVASTAEHVALLRRRGRASQLVASVVTRDGRTVYETELDGRHYGTIASDGRDFYAAWLPFPWWTDRQVVMQKLAPGAARTRLLARTKGRVLADQLRLVYHAGRLVLLWKDEAEFHLQNVDAAGAESVRVNLRAPEISAVYPGSDELLAYGWYRSGPVFWRIPRRGWAAEPDPEPVPKELGYPRCAWAGTQLGCVFRTYSSRLFTLRDAAGVPRITSTFSSASYDQPAIAAAGDRFVVLTHEGPTRVVTLFDALGVPRDRVPFDAAPASGYDFLVPLDDEHMLAVCSRPDPAPPYYAARRWVARLVEIRQ
jgi:hypothetical protein